MDWNAETPSFMLRPEASAELVLAVSMKVNGSESQSLGFMELKKPDSFDELEKLYGKLPNSSPCCPRTKLPRQKWHSSVMEFYRL
jgi:hypothetical protein